MSSFDPQPVHLDYLSDRLRLQMGDLRVPIAQRAINALRSFTELVRNDDSVGIAVVLISRVADFALRNPEVKSQLAHGQARCLVNNVVRFINWRVDELSGNQAFEVTLALERLGGSFSPQVVLRLGERICEDLACMSTRQLFVAVRAMDSLRGTDREFYSTIFHRLVPRSLELENAEFAALNQIFSFHNQAGFAEIGLDVAELRLSEFTDRELLRFAVRVGDFGLRSDDTPAFVREVSARLVRAAETGRELLETAAEAIISSVRQGIENGELQRLFGDRASDQLAFLSGAQLAWTTWAYSESRYRHEGLLNRISSEFISRLADFSGQEIALVCGSLRRLDVSHEPLLVAISQHFRGDFRGLRPKDLAELAYSFALLDDQRGALNVRALQAHMNVGDPSIEARYRMHIAAVAAGVEDVSQCSRELKGYALSKMPASQHEVLEKICHALRHLGISAAQHQATRLIGVVYPDLTLVHQGKRFALFVDYSEASIVDNTRVLGKSRIIEKYLRCAGYEPLRVFPQELKGLEDNSLGRLLGRKMGILSGGSGPGASRAKNW